MRFDFVLRVRMASRNCWLLCLVVTRRLGQWDTRKSFSRILRYARGLILNLIWSKVVFVLDCVLYLLTIRWKCCRRSNATSGRITQSHCRRACEHTLRVKSTRSCLRNDAPRYCCRAMSGRIDWFDNHSSIWTLSSTNFHFILACSFVRQRKSRNVYDSLIEEFKEKKRKITFVQVCSQLTRLKFVFSHCRVRFASLMRTPNSAS